MDTPDELEEGAVCRGRPNPQTLEGKLELAESERDRAGHALHAALQLVARLKGLVGDAFQEGFRRRDPDHDDPWLIDWLQSDSKRELEELFSRRPPGPPPR